jgi:hypothetical protein
MSSRAVFLSYASQDADAARKVAEALRAASIEVWFDVEGGLEHGDEWDQKIRRQIKECVLFLPLISANTQAREEGYFRIEWELAAERAMGIASGVAFILPIVIDDTREPDALVPDRFRKVQWTRLPGGVVTAEVQARLLKLWSHRVGALTHTEGLVKQDGGGGALPQDAQEPAVPSRWPWLAMVVPAIVVVGGVGLLTWWVMRDAKPAIPGDAPATVAVAPKSAGPSEAQQLTPAQTSATVPRSPARELAAKALALIRQVETTREDVALAEDYCTRAMKLDDADGEVWAVLSQVHGTYVYRGWDLTAARREQSRVTAERAIRMVPRSVEARLAQAGAWANFSVNRVETEKLLREIVQEQPTSQYALRFLAAVVLNQGRLEESVAINARSAALPGGDPLALFNSARAYLARNLLAEAEAALNASLAQKPFASARVLSAYFDLTWRGDLKAAEASLQELPGSSLLEDRANYHTGLLRYYQRDARRALEAWRSFPREAFNDFTYYGPKGYLVGLAYALGGQEQAARVEWQAALKWVGQQIERTPNHQRLLQLKAQLLASLGERAAAEAALEVAMEMAGLKETPDSPLNFGAAMVYARLGKLDDLVAKLPASLANPGQTAMWPKRLQLDPRFDPARADPQFVKLVDDAAASAVKAAGGR